VAQIPSLPQLRWHYADGIPIDKKADRLTFGGCGVEGHVGVSERK